MEMERRQAKVEQQDEVGDGNRNLRESRKQAKVEEVRKYNWKEKKKERDDEMIMHVQTAL